jgi:hypothetical protein
MFFCYYREKRTMFLDPTLDPALVLGTRSDTRSSTQYCTKTQGELAVMVLAASDGQIEHMGFVYHRPLQLLSSRQLDFSCPKRAIIGFLRFVSYGRIYCILPNLEVVRPSCGRPLGL